MTSLWLVLTGSTTRWGQVAHPAERETMEQEFHAGYERLMADPKAWVDHVCERGA